MRHVAEFISRHPWLLAWPHATNLELSAARPPTLRVCARAVRATRSPRAHGSLPYGQPSAPVGLRIRAYGSPLARSASGRVLSPPYAAVWPNARSTGARGQRASRPASGAHPTRGRPVCCVIRVVRVRPVHQPARAAKPPRGRHSDSHRKPQAAQPTVPHPSRCSFTGGCCRAVTAPLETDRTCSTSNRKPAPDSLTCGRIRLAIPGSKPMPTCDETPPETRPSDPRAPTRSPSRRRSRQLRSRQRACGRWPRPRHTT